MTEQPPPPYYTHQQTRPLPEAIPGQPTPAHPTEPAMTNTVPSKRTNPIGRIALGIAALIVVGAIGGVVGYLIGSNSTNPASEPAAATTSVETQPASAPATTAAYVPQPTDFTVVVDVLKRECFGSAGCDITYRVQPTYHGPTLDQSQQYTVTYQLTGAQDGASVGSFTLQGGTAEVEQEDIAQTPNSATKLTAQVTQVLAG